MSEELTGFCSRCKEACYFERDPQYPDLLYSACCGWEPLNLPEEDA